MKATSGTPHTVSRGRTFLSMLLACMLAISLIPTLPTVALGDSGVWGEGDFVVANNEIVGLSSAGLEKLSENNGSLEIPAIAGVDTIATGFTGAEITSLTIAPGYTTIAQGVFTGNAIASLQLPASIAAIGQSAFQGNQLASVSLPASLTLLGASAFADNALTSVDFSALAISEIPESAFKDNALTNLVLPSTLTSIAAGAFANNNISSIDAPGLAHIGSQSFYSNSLGTVNLPSITTIADDAFTGNGRVVAITTGGSSATSWFEAGNGHIVNPVTITIKYVDELGNAIKSETTLGNDFSSADLYTPGSNVTVTAPLIHGYMPVGDTEQSVDAAPGATVTFTYEETTGEPVITVGKILFMTGTVLDEAALLEHVSAVSGVDGSAVDTLSVAPTNESDTLPLDTTSPGVYQVTYRAIDAYGNVGTRTVTITVMLDPMDDYIGASPWQYKDFIYDGSTLKALSADGRNKFNTEKNVTLPGINPTTGEAITTITTRAFTQAFTGVDFSFCEELTTIGTRAFSDARLTALDLSNNKKLSLIDQRAFENSPLTSLTLNSPALTGIGLCAFDYAKLTALDLSECNALTTIGFGAFRYSPLTELHLPADANLTSIGMEAFKYARLTELDLTPYSELTEIGQAAFQYSPLTELDLSGNPKLKTIGLKNAGTQYPEKGAFAAAKLTELDLSNNPELTVIGNSTFASSLLTSLDLSNNTKLTTIGISAFAKSPLVTLDLSNHPELTIIDESAFAAAKLTNLDFSEFAALTTIGKSAFENSPLVSLQLPSSSLQTIGDSAFKNATITELDFSNFSALTSIGHSAFAAAKLTRLTLKNCTNLKTIGGAAFKEATLTELDLSDLENLTSIGSEAFQKSPFTELDFSKCLKLTTIGSSAFQNARLTKLDMSKNTKLQVIGNRSFMYSPLTYLDLSKCTELTRIEGSAFRYAKLTEVDLSQCTKLTTIGDSSFYNSELTSITIGKITNSTGNIYGLSMSVVPDTIYISFHNAHVPVYVLDYDGTVKTAAGYRINPVRLTINYVDEVSGNTINPSKQEWLSWPVSNHEVSARTIYGYTPVAQTQTVSVEKPDPVGTVEQEVTIAYRPVDDTSIYDEWLGFSLSQDTVIDYARIGSLLETRVKLSVTNFTGHDLKGMQINLYYDEERISPMKEQDTSNSAYSVNTSTPGIVTITFKESAPGSSFSLTMPIRWNLKPGVTEEFQGHPVMADLLTAPDQDGKQMAVRQANTVELSGFYGNPMLTVYANGTPQNSEVYYGEVDETTGRYYDEDVSITYQPSVTKLERNIESITYTSNIPTYEYYDEQTNTWSEKLAEFDPAKNPGWTLSDGELIYTYTGLNTMQPPAPKLVLDFPGIKPYTTVANTMSFTAEPYEKGHLERTFTASDDIINSVSGIEIPPGETFIKYAGNNNRSAVFYDTDSSKAQQFAWTLFMNTTSGPEGGYVGDLVLYDEDLDDRMYYYAIHMDVLGGATVNGYNASGELVYTVPNASGRLTFPAHTGGTNDIARVEIDASMLKIEQGTRVNVKLYSKLKDPDAISYEDCSQNGTLEFRNSAGVQEGNYYTSDGRVSSGINARWTAHWRIMEYVVSVELSKSILGKKDAYFTDKPIVYDLSFNYALDGKGAIPASSLDTVATNFEVYDVLPIHMVPTAFKPSEGLVMGSINLRYELLGEFYEDGEGKHNVVRITADKVDLSKVSSLGSVTAEFEDTFPANATLVNKAYASFDVDDPIKQINFIKTTSDGNNPIGKTGVLTDSASLYASAPTMSKANKSARVEVIDEQGDSAWGVWQREIKTRPGERFQYRMFLLNDAESSAPREDIVLIDVLPIVGDTEIVNPGNDRGSQFENTLESVEVPAGYTVWYLKDTGPLDYGGQTADEYFDDPVRPWTTDDSDLSQVRAIKITSNDGVSLAPGQYAQFYITMKATTDRAMVDKRSVNSFVQKGRGEDRYLEAAPVTHQIYKPAKITLYKYRGASGSSVLPGAQFGLYDATGDRLLAVGTTNELGRIEFAGIERGDYLIKELAAPEGYELLASPISVPASRFSDNNGTADEFSASITVRNTASLEYGQLIIDKLDAEGAPLEGIRFTLTNTANSAITYAGTTDGAGRIMFSRVQTGTYRVTEVSAPNHLQAIAPFNISIGTSGNLALPGWPSQVTLDPTGKIKVEVVNNQASIGVYKLGITDPTLFDVPESSLRPNSGRPLSSVTLALHKQDSGLTFSHVSDHETDLFGMARIEGLEAKAVYYLEETAASVPPGWKAADRVYFQINAEGKVFQVKLDSDGTIIDDETTAFVADAVVVKDLPSDGVANVFIDKVDERGNPLAGATFHLQKQDGEDEQGQPVWGAPSEYVSDGEGLITIEGLESGTYRIYEHNAPEGYIKSTDSYTFTVVDGQKSTQVFEFSYANASAKPIIVKGEYVETFYLDDPTQHVALERAREYLESQGFYPQSMPVSGNRVILLAGLGGAVFEVVEYEGLSTQGTPKAVYSITSEIDGSFDLTDTGLAFKPGHSYTFEETVAPAGYEKREGIAYTYQPDIEHANILANGGMWIPLENKVKDHRIIVSKYATDTMAGLSGTAFKLLNPDGSEVIGSDGGALEASSDDKGFVEFSGLAPGIYYVKEVATADGYILPENVYYRVEILGAAGVGGAGRPTYADTIGTNESNTIIDQGSSEGSSTLVVYNLREHDPYTLSIEKLVVGTPSSNAVFSFSVAFKGEGDNDYVGYSGPYVRYAHPGDTTGQILTMADGACALAHGQRIVIPGLDEGDQYKVVEDTSDENFMYSVTVDKNGEGGVASPEHVGSIEGADSLVFTNTIDPLDPPFEKDVTVNEEPDSANGATVVPGDILTYSLSYTNDVGSILDTVEITDIIPEHTAFVSASDSGILQDGKLSWNFTNVDIGAVIEVSFRVVVLESALEQTVENTGAVSIGGNDPRNSNTVHNPVEEEPEEPESVDPLPDDPEKGIDVVKRVDKPEAQPGDELVYTLEVKNTGDEELLGVSITDKLDQALSFQRASDGGTCDVFDGVEQVSWFIDRLDVGQTIELTLVVKIREDVGVSKEIPNTAVYRLPGDPDGTPTNEVVVTTPPEDAIVPRTEAQSLLVRTGDHILLAVIAGVALFGGIAAVLSRAKRERRHTGI